MKKTSLLMLCVAVLAVAASCDLSSPLSPPSWIVGTWSDPFGITYWQFTADDVILTTGEKAVDLKKLFISGGLSDEATDASYIIYTTTSQGTETNRFDKVDAYTINYTYNEFTVPLTRIK